MDDLADWRDSLPANWTAGCEAEVFAQAHMAYSTSSRHYHTWAHVLDCTEKLRGFPLAAPRAAFMAILFHDAIYVAGARDNEELSAEMAATVLERHSSMPASEREATRRMILATRDHRVPDSDPSTDVRVVVDVDMSILGAAPSRYDAYAAEVHAEWVPAAASARAFRAGRLDFLSRVLDQPRIFHTALAIDRWERSARENIAREISRLRADRDWIDFLLGWGARRSRRA